MKLPLSIIIPALNEEKYLPHLLKSIQNQTQQPTEIIVSDANSKDKTREIAKEFGCKVVIDNGAAKGPGNGRNSGAKHATQNLLLFLDADGMLPPDFLEKAFYEMQQRKLSIATCFVLPSTPNLFDRVGANLMNYYFLAMQHIQPHAGGYCIFITKTIHEKIGGYDVSLALGEDHDYVQRASKFGKFAFIRSTDLIVSSRRFQEEGRLKTTLKYLIAEITILAGKKNRKKLFVFEFGNHTSTN